MNYLRWNKLRACGAVAWRVAASDWIDWIALLGLMVVAVVRSGAYHGVVIDDSFITFRHAANLVRGHGFSCDPTQRVEGTSSPLFAALMLLPIALSFEPYRFATWITTAAFAGCVPTAYLMVRAAIVDATARIIGLCAATLVALSPILAFHSQTGLETLLYALVLAIATWQFMRSLSLPSPSSRWAVFMGVAALTRPEGCLLFALLGCALGFLRRKDPRRWRQMARDARAFAAVWVPWLLFRFAYYGKWWPNSVIAKAGYRMGIEHPRASGILERIVHGEGTAMLVEFVSAHSFEMAWLLGAVVFRKARLPVALAVTMTFAYALMATWNGGDWMPNYRLLTACLTPLTAAAALGLRGFLFHSEQRGFRHLPSLLLTVLAVGVAVPSATTVTTSVLAIKELPALRAMGTDLSKISRADDLVVSAMAGILPYYWDVRTVDMHGLCDTHISGSGKPLPLGLGRFDAPYLIAKRPTFYAFEYPFLAVEFFNLLEFAPYRNDYLMLQYPYGSFGSKTFSPPVILVRKDRPELERLSRVLGVRLVGVEQELRRTGFLRTP